MERAYFFPMNINRHPVLAIYYLLVVQGFVFLVTSILYTVLTEHDKAHTLHILAGVFCAAISWGLAFIIKGFADREDKE
jgi:uncharacterized BrkB/YihY/UPF0761 family membrane protein